MSQMVLSGLGLITSLGHSVEESCAAIRCGMARPHPLEGMTAWDLGAEQEVPLIGYPVTGLMDGFQGVGRWFRLGRHALRDLLRYCQLDAADPPFWHPCGFIVCLPVLHPDRFAFPEEEAQALPRRLLQALGLPIPQQNVSIIEAGAEGPLMALQHAREKLATGAWHRALILSIDSLVEASSLRWLKVSRRLKTPEHPTGLMAGEASACILVEAPRQAGERAEAWVDPCVIAPSPGQGLPAIQWGQTLSRVIHEALPGAGRVGDILGNHNGEVRRAMAWGTARQSLPAEALLDGHRETWPATSLGDVGIASSLVAFCIAARSFSRSYSRGDTSLIWSLSDDGAAGACIVRRKSSR